MANEKVYVGEIGAKELYLRIKRLINNFGGFEEAQGTGADNHPSVLNPSTKIIYLVPIDSSTEPNKFTEWYYHIDPTTQAGSWETLGVTNFVENSWKHWSEEHGSTSADSTETSVYIGKNNTITSGPYGDNYVIGAENSLKSGFIFGQSNTANNLNALIVGSSNTSTSYDTIIIGNQNSAADYGSAVFGYGNTLTKGHDCSIFGSENTLNENTANNSQASTIHGRANVARDFYISDLFGSSNQCYQDDRSIFNIKSGHTERNYFTSIFGQSISAYDNRLSSIVGYNNTVSKMFESIVMGVSVKATSLSSNTEGTGNVIIAAYNGEIPIQASHSALVFGYGGSAHGSYNAIFGIAPRVGDTSVSGSSGESNYNAGIAGFSTTIKPQSFTNLFLTTYETINGSNNVVIDQFGHTVGDNNISIGQYNSIGEYTPTKRNYSIAIGKSNTIQRDHATAIGESNTITFNDNTDYAGTYVSSFGQNNTATNAANAYQIGRDNTVTGNNLSSIQSYPHQTAINLGVYNSITMEGVNIGKDNTSERFGVSIGQSNSSVGGSVAIGRETIAGLNSGREGAFTFGSRVEAYAGSMAIGIASDTGFITAGRASTYDGGYFSGSSFALGIGELHVLENSFGIGMSQPVSPAAQNANQVLPAKVSGNSFGIICDTITCDTSSDHRSRIEGNSMGIGSRLTVNQASIGIGYEVHSSKSSLAIGRQLTNIIDDAIVFGKLNNNIGSRSTSCTIAGYEYSSASGKAIALGYSNSFIHQESFAVGFNNSNIISKCAVFGNGINNVRDESIALGFSCGNIYNDAIVIGHTNIDVSNTSIAIGKSNYSIDTNSIAIGHGNVNITNASIAMGLSTSAENASIVMGIGNHAIGGAIMFGIGNYSYENLKTMPKFTTNAFIAGLGNTAHSVREKWQNADFASGVNPFGCIVGAYIKSYGHNAISIGAFNIVGDSENWETDTTMLTDNDGFMTAIGYKCEALRNYDFAFGYKSIAKGGENVAIQHSSAIGYRNVALVDSNINGIANFGILESYLGSSASNTSNKRVHNILAKSRVQCNDTPFYDNIVIGSTMTAPTTAGDNYPTSANIIIDNSAITGKAYTIQHNILFNQSSITSTKSTTGFDSSTIFDNIAFNESTLEYRDLDSAWSGSQQPLGHNISFGSYMGNTYGCVSIADRRVNDASLFNSLRVFNFGDNSISCTGESYCFGQSNTISWASRAFVCGHQNTFNGRATSLGDSNNVIRHLTVFGNLNETSISDGSKIDRVFINGHKNKVSTNIFDARIFGNENQLGWQFSEDTSTHETLTFAELKARQVQHPTVFITADEPVFVMGISGRVYSSQPGELPIQNNAVYLYCKGSVRQLYSSDYSGQTVVSISGDDFIRGTISRTLTDWGYYRVTSAPTIQHSINELTRLWSSGAKVMKYPDGTIYSIIDGTDNHCNARDTIFGSNNTIQPAVNDTTIFGSDNLVSNPLQYPISNSFIQGNNNVVTNGSNIFVAGNGCVGNGHGAVAIGCQVKANHWQTVIGKYNEWVPGPDRLTPGEDDSDAALFVIGNGYSENDGPDWQNEAYIHRSNAMEVYADGTVKAKKFVSDEPDFELVEGNGIQLETNVSAETITISAKQPLPPTPTTPGAYALQCVVDTNGTPTLSWVSIGMSNV